MNTSRCLLLYKSSSLFIRSLFYCFSIYRSNFQPLKKNNCPSSRALSLSASKVNCCSCRSKIQDRSEPSSPALSTRLKAILMPHPVQRVATELRVSIAASWRLTTVGASGCILREKTSRSPKTSSHLEGLKVLLKDHPNITQLTGNSEIKNPRQIF